MDMHLTPYRVVSTGKESGMIEVVLNAETTANIQKVIILFYKTTGL